MEQAFDSKSRTLAAGQNIKERDYWMEKLSGELVKTTFPADNHGTGQKDMKSTRFQLTESVYNDLLRISNKADVRLHIILVTGWLMQLYRYTGNTDIILGIPTYKQEVEGKLINTVLALRSTLNGNMTVKELLIQQGKTLLEANENQNYPMDTLVYKLNLPDSDGDFPLFDISVLLEGLHDKSYLDHIEQNMVISFRKINGTMEGEVEYNAARYNESTIDRIIRHFCQLLGNALTDVNQPVGQVEMMSPQERRQVMIEFNDNTAEFSRDRSIYKLVEEYAEKTPEAAALTFEGSDITYERLNARANRLAHLLVEYGVTEDHTVGVQLERTPAMVEAILAVWKAGGAYIPLDTETPIQRLQGILSDSGTRVLFARNGTGKSLSKEQYDGIIIDPEMEDDDVRTEHNLDKDISMHSLAYVIYTSGSTGRPKGAMVEHIGMMNHIQSKVDILNITARSVVAQNASHTFDISVWQFFVALTQGGRTVIYTDELVLDPLALIERINSDGLTILEVVPSYLSVILDAVEAKQKEPVPLPIRYLLVTGEEVKPFLVKRWFDKYPKVPVVNAYGPTEASDDITHHLMTEAPDTPRIPIGKPVQNLDIYIVDDNMNICPVGVKGELCVSGVGVGRGYLKDEEKTRLAFMDDPFKEEKGVRMYKTGDLAAWNPDGTIDFFGRKDYQVKIRGFRIELGEIENRLTRHPQIKEAVVMDRESNDGEKYLCAYIVAAEQGKDSGELPGNAELKKHLLESLPDYMVPAHYVKLDSLPLTPNGKVDRKALPEPDTGAARPFPYLSEEKINQLKEAMESTGDARTIQKKQLHHDPATELLEEYAALKKYSKGKGITYYPLTHSERVFYYNDKIYAGTGLGMINYTVKYDEILDLETFNHAVNQVIKNNDNLRIKIEEVELDSGIKPSQQVRQYKPYRVDSQDFSGREEQFGQWERETTAKPIPLLGDRLYYISYVKFNDRESGYYIKLHHIISDSCTLYLIFQEIHRHYRLLQSGQPLEEKQNLSYTQYIYDERDYITSPDFKEDRRFWHNEMLPLPGEADISGGMTKGMDHTHIEGDARVLSVPDDVWKQIVNFKNRENSSYFSIFLTALAIYVSKITRLEDFVIGTVNHGRSKALHREIGGAMIAFFPFRVNVDNDISFRDFVNRNRNGVRSIIKNHGRYPFDTLLSELREISGVDPYYLNNINIVSHPPENAEYKVKFCWCSHTPAPLTLHLNRNNKEKEGIMELGWEYRKAYFTEADIRQIHRGIVAILADAVTQPDKSVSDVDMLSEEEKKQILYEFNDTESPFPHDKTITQLFEEQVERTPANIAASEENKSQSLTYDELNRKANRLARRLRENGVGADAVAAVIAKRSISILIGMMAIMKAGGAYLSIAISYPENRIDFMCDDSGANYILTDNTRQLPGREHRLIDITSEENVTEESENLEPVNTSRHPAAIFYTSGSTGKPKGVVVEHRGLVNRLVWLNKMAPMEETDIILQKTPVIFDVSIWELFGWTIAGASVCFMDAARGDSPKDIVEAVIKSGATHLHLPPASQLGVLEYIETQGKLGDVAALKLVVASGEALVPAHVNAFNRLLYRHNGTRLYNLYGPTEASIEVSYYDCSSDEPIHQVPIGKPIDNVQLLIVDENLNLVPVGVVGQLCIAGVCLAREYMNRPDLTEKFFKENPYQPGERMYLTGDLARWKSDGNIEFLGRIDRQVQVGGIRVELGEIESYLLEQDQIKEAAVIQYTDPDEEWQELCAFLEVDGSLRREQLKEVLAQQLPPFMIPGIFIEMDRLPKTDSGKIDRKRLADWVPLARREVKNSIRDLEMRKKIGAEKALTAQYIDNTGMLWEKEGADGEQISEEEIRLIQQQFNATDAQYPENATLHRIFEEQTERTPQNPAVTGTDGIEETKNRTLTYREFNERANRLAHKLRQEGVGPGTIVAVFTERTLRMMEAIYAVMKAGGAYMAISLTTPEKRIQYMLKDSGAKIILTDNTRSLPEYDAKQLDLTDESNYTENSGNIESGTGPDDAAVVFYTSGSTGNPKGVILDHRGMVNRLNWKQRQYPLTETDVILQKTNIIFDVSLWELFWWNFAGASLYLMSPGKGDQPQDTVEAVKEGRVTRIHFVPTPMIPFLNYVEASGEEAALATLQHVFASGEALPAALVERFNNLLYKTNGTRLHNLYGPTEASIDVTGFACSGIDTPEQIPIGKPIDNVHLYILDNKMRMLPVGKAGQLCISGISLARGYLNRPELTRRAFQPNPYEPGERLYLTGDLARWQPDGNIEFLGRIDRQVQINGIRVEVEEIENLLFSHDDIKEAVVVPRVDENNELYLGAFVVAAENLLQSDFREMLIRELPHYMVPAQYIELEKLPLTPSAKVDRKLLGKIKLEFETSQQTEFVEPKTEIETTIVRIWKQVLSVERIGVNDNFFDLGGNSLGIIQVNLKLKEEFQRDIPALVMFEHSTVSGLAEYLEKNAPGSEAAEKARELEQEKEKERAEVKSKGKNRMQQRREKRKNIQ
jgi:amino acid adenylation domain-containing protein